MRSIYSMLWTCLRLLSLAEYCTSSCLIVNLEFRFETICFHFDGLIFIRGAGIRTCHSKAEYLAAMGKSGVFGDELQ